MVDNTRTEGHRRRFFAPYPTGSARTVSGESFAYGAVVCAVLAACIEFATVNGMWATIFPAAATKEWFALLIGHLPAGLLIVGIPMAWLAAKVDKDVWASPAAWACGLIGYAVYISFAQNLAAPLAVWLSGAIPFEYCLSAATLLIGAAVSLLVVKLAGRFALGTPVGISQEIVALAIVAVVVVIAINGAGLSSFHDLVYGALDQQTADVVYASAEKVGVTVSQVNIGDFVPAAMEGANQATRIVVQIFTILVKYLPQLVVSIVVLSAFRPKERA